MILKHFFSLETDSVLSLRAYHKIAVLVADDFSDDESAILDTFMKVYNTLLVQQAVLACTTTVPG